MARKPMGISGPTIFRRPRERRIIRELKAARESSATLRNLKATALFFPGRVDSRRFSTTSYRFLPQKILSKTINFYFHSGWSFLFIYSCREDSLFEIIEKRFFFCLKFRFVSFAEKIFDKLLETYKKKNRNFFVVN